jgi:hypothetical protein
MFRCYPTRVTTEGQRTRAHLLTLTLLATRYQILLHWANCPSNRLSPAAQQQLPFALLHRQLVRNMPLRGPPKP